jgi:hypothetical protein
MFMNQSYSKEGVIQTPDQYIDLVTTNKKGLDLNNDGVIDFKRKYNNNKLIEYSYDINFDGVMDVNWKRGKIFDQTLFDKNLDGKIDYIQRKSTKVSGDHSFSNIHFPIITHAEIDSNFDGVFDKSTSHSSTEFSIGGSWATCGDRQAPGWYDFKSDLEGLSEIPSTNHTNFGYVIDSSCDETQVARLRNVISTSVDKSFNCLKNNPLLSKLAYNYAIKLFSHRPRITCGQIKQPIEKCASGRQGGSLITFHPHSFTSCYDLPQLLFHETLHNIGARHEEVLDKSTDLIYSCARYCFSSTYPDDQSRCEQLSQSLF